MFRPALIILVITLLAFISCNSQAKKIERAYQACVEKFNAEAANVTKSMAEEATKKDPFAASVAQGMGEAMKGMVGGMGTAVCDSMKKQCETDPDGQMCKSFIGSF